jgi:hypothetical protein
MKSLIILFISLTTFSNCLALDFSSSVPLGQINSVNMKEGTGVSGCTCKSDGGCDECPKGSAYTCKDCKSGTSCRCEESGMTLKSILAGLVVLLSTFLLAGGFYFRMKIDEAQK